MYKTLYLSVVGCGFLAVNVGFAQTPPTSGSYATDPTNTYVQDQALDSISSVNMIMCFMGGLRPEQKAGDGPYNALVDRSKCQSKGSTGETTAAGSTSSVNYTNVVVDATRASTAEALKASAWVDMKEEGMSIYTYTTVSTGASATQPNGVFTMEFSGYPVSSPTTIGMRGSLSASGTNVSFYETGQSQGGGNYTTALTLSLSGADSGTGRVSDNSRGGARVETTLAYNSTHFKRQQGATAQCFSRAAADGDYSTWRYGVYKADGSRLNLTNPAFEVNFTTGPNLYYGQAGFYGVFFPETALTAMGTSANLTRPNSTKNYTYSTVGGKLTKLSKGETTLGGVKGQNLRVWIPGSSGETKVAWNGTALEKKETMTCGSSGCSGVAATGTVSASTLRGQNFRSLNGWSDSVGGSLMVEVPSSGEFLASTKVFYRTRTAVTPAQASALTLICVSDCLAGKAVMGPALSASPPTTPYTTVGSSTQNWGPTPVANAKTYVFTGSGMMVIGTNTTDVNSHVDASGFTSSQLQGQYQNGLRSGMLVPSASTAIKCDSTGITNSSGTHICPHLFQNLVDTYEWETGLKPWNKYAGLTEVGGAAVAFDPPKRLTLTLSSTNSTLPASNTKIGSQIMLDYNGFGNLGGIPGSCYNPATHIKGPCGATNTASAPDFSLKEGAVVTDGTTSYFIKPIDQEIRFGKVADSFCDGLTLPTTGVLPAANVAVDPKVTIGTKPTPRVAAPAVVHGVVQ